MKYETMLKILFLLLAKPKVSAREMANRFDVSVRTIMRYIDVISLVVPVLSDTGRNGGFYIADSYKLPASFLTEKEFNAVVSTLSSYNEEVSNKTISSAIDKLVTAKRKEIKTVNFKSENLIIDGSSWNGNDNVKSIVSLISNAIDDLKQVFIGYVDKGGKESKRVIEPHAIILKQGLWYVYAYCTLRNGFRMFKVSRITFADVKDQTFEKRKISLDSLTSGKWFEKLPVQQIELAIEKTAVPDVEEWLGVNCVYKKGDNYFASISLPYDNFLVSKILSFAGKVKVISPQILIDEIKTSIKEINSLYD